MPGAPQHLLVAFASQTGLAERLAWQTASTLQAAGVAVTVRPLDRVDSDALNRFARALFVVSTFGQGEPPDNARTFARTLLGKPLPLNHMHFGLLALGDRQFPTFCGFGRAFYDWLRRHGAQPLFEPVEVDQGDPLALRSWQSRLGELTGGVDMAAWTAPGYGRWRLTARHLLNPGSAGTPTYHLELEAVEPAAATWVSGDLAEVIPRHSAEAIVGFLRAADQNGDTLVRVDGHLQTLAEVLARSVLPAPEAVKGQSAQALTDSLQPLPPRQYSIASLPKDGHIHLLVRQALSAGGLGLGSGWLTKHAPLGSDIELRIRPNPGFHLVEDDRPLILIGNGTGLAGLRSHLKARIAAGFPRNWLVFGERSAAHDFYYRDEILEWRARGMLQRLDLAFSRDQAERVYVQQKLWQAADVVRAWLTRCAASPVLQGGEG